MPQKWLPGTQEEAVGRVPGLQVGTEQVRTCGNRTGTSMRDNSSGDSGHQTRAGMRGTGFAVRPHWPQQYPPAVYPTSGKTAPLSLTCRVEIMSYLPLQSVLKT